MKKTSQYKGVAKNSNLANAKWMATITVNGVVNYLGCYETEREAARAYDMFVMRRGLNRKLNLFTKKVA